MKSARTVAHRIPVARDRRVDASAIFLHDQTAHNVLERLAQLRQTAHDLFADDIDPLRHALLVVHFVFETTLDARHDDAVHFLRYERQLLR